MERCRATLGRRSAARGPRSALRKGRKLTLALWLKERSDDLSADVTVVPPDAVLNALR